MFARTLAPASKVSKSVIALLKAFNWSKFVIITAARPAWGSQITQAIKVNSIKFKININKNNKAINLYFHIKDISRVKKFNCNRCKRNIGLYTNTNFKDATNC